jgi:microcystin-dependent protein
MPRAAMRDPNTGTMVPILGGVDDATATARFLPLASPTLSGTLTVLDPTASTHPAHRKYADSITPVGSIAAIVGASAPSGWILCQGAAVSRITYADLYAVIGTRYGVGDGSTTFNVPDLRDRVPTALYSASAEYDTLGETGGATDVTISQSQFPAASGQFNFHGSGSRTSLANAYGGTGAVYVASGVAAYGNPQYNQTGASSVGIATIDYGGGGGSHTNVQPSIALHFAIRT